MASWKRNKQPENDNPQTDKSNKYIHLDTKPVGMDPTIILI